MDNLDVSEGSAATGSSQDQSEIESTTYMLSYGAQPDMQLMYYSQHGLSAAESSPALQRHSSLGNERHFRSYEGMQNFAPSSFPQDSTSMGMSYGAQYPPAMQIPVGTFDAPAQHSSTMQADQWTGYMFAESSSPHPPYGHEDPLRPPHQ